MPGIFGISDPAAAQSVDRQRELLGAVRRMAAAMQYDSSYCAHIVSCAEAGVCVGRVGFSSACVTQCAAEGVFVVTTGEPQVYEFCNTAPDPVCTGIGTGARELGRLYKERGEDHFGRVTGPFSAFVIDTCGAQCILVCDRYGMERVFVHTDGAITLFASEAKAILAVTPETRAFALPGVAELLACGCTLGQRSPFEGIEILEGGAILSFGPGGTKRRRYLKPSVMEYSAPVSDDSVPELLADSLHTAVNTSVTRSPGAAVSLTGGLDSRMIMASLDVPGAVPCYTFASMYRTTSDVAIAATVAASCGCPHHVLELGSEFLNTVHDCCDRSVYISDGYIGLSGAAELYVNRMARTLAGARVTGNWGGELLRGVRAFRHTIPQGAFIQPVLSRYISESAETFSRSIATDPLSYVLFHQIPMQGYGRYAVERSQVLMRSPFLDNSVVNSLYAAAASARSLTECSQTVLQHRPALLNIPTDVGLLGKARLPVRIARQMFLKAIAKAEYMTSHGAPHWLAHVSALLPEAALETRFLGRNKFQHFRYWIRKHMAGFIRDTIRSRNTSLHGWFDMMRVSSLVEEHIAGRRNFTDEIDKVMTLLIAERTLLSPPAAAGNVVEHIELPARSHVMSRLQVTHPPSRAHPSQPQWRWQND